jgi:hypothetical protein
LTHLPVHEENLGCIKYNKKSKKPKNHETLSHE